MNTPENESQRVDQWEYLHVRATVGIRDYSAGSLFDRTTSAVFHVNGEQVDIKVNDYSGADIQDAVVAILNNLGREGWEMVSHTDRVSDQGFVRGPTEYTFFMKRRR